MTMIPPPPATPKVSGVTSPERNGYMALVMQQLMDDLQYPQAKDGTQMDANAFKHIIAYHLVRAGWRKPNNHDHLALREEFDDPLIKKRKVTGPGVLEDAVHWVSIAEPDDPLAGLEKMTVGDIEALPDELRFEAKRRLGLIGEPTPEDVPDFGVEPWSIKPHLTITDAPDPGDIDFTTPERG